MLMLFLIVQALWVALHGYLGWRLLRPTALARRAHDLLYALLVLLGVASPPVLFADVFTSPPYTQIYRWVAWTYIGGFSTLFALVFARDLTVWVVALVDRVRMRMGRTSFRPSSAERRKFLLNTSSKAALGITAGVTAWGLPAARRRPEVVEVEVPIEGLPRELDGYHIVQLSDVHVGETIEQDFVLPIVEMATSLAPDLIALTGDLVDGRVAKLHTDISPFGYLRARDGVLCVTGNHEYYSGVEEWCEHFRELGLTVLINQHVVVQRGAARMLIGGVTDLREGKRVHGHTSDPHGALAGAPAHDLRILLAHQPRSAFEASKHGYKLQLSGHTHAGQFFPWNLFVGLVQPLSQGLGKIEGMWVYVNRGTCYWGPPNRAGTSSEITSLRLRRA